MSEKKIPYKEITRNLKKFSRSLDECKRERPHDTLKGIDKVHHYITKIEHLMPIGIFGTSPIPNETMIELINLWDSCVEFLIKIPSSDCVYNITNMIYQIITLEQLLPINLVEFPAPDDVSSSLKKILDSYYTTMTKTILYIIYGIEGDEFVVEYSKRTHKTRPQIPSKKKKLSSFQFSSSIRQIHRDIYDEIAKIFVVLTIRFNNIYEEILETINMLNKNKFSDKNGIVLTEELKQNYSCFNQWESFGKFVCSKNQKLERLGQAINGIDQKWLLHFDCRSQFAMYYLRFWAEYVHSTIKFEPTAFPGYDLFVNELYTIGQLDFAKMNDVQHIYGQAVGAFGVIDENVYKQAIEYNQKKCNLYSLEHLGMLLLLQHFVYTYIGGTIGILKGFDFEIFKKLMNAVFDTDFFETLCMCISTLYQLLPILPAKERQKVIIDYLLDEKLFRKLFCHWNQTVRSFYMELVMYRLTISPSIQRIQSNELLSIEKERYKTLQNETDIDLLEFDKKVIGVIEKRIAGIEKGKKKGFSKKEEKKLNVYIEMALKDYQEEKEEYTKWELKKIYEPHYLMLEMTRLNKFESNNEESQ